MSYSMSQDHVSHATTSMATAALTGEEASQSKLATTSLTAEDASEGTTSKLAAMRLGCPDKQAKIGFLDLPAELRLQVYEYILDDVKEHPLTHGWPLLADRTSSCWASGSADEYATIHGAAALLQTCRTVHNDFVEAFYGSFRFEFYANDWQVDEISPNIPLTMKHIKSVWVSFWLGEQHQTHSATRAIKVLCIVNDASTELLGGEQNWECMDLEMDLFHRTPWHHAVRYRHRFVEAGKQHGLFTSDVKTSVRAWELREFGDYRFTETVRPEVRETCVQVLFQLEGYEKETREAYFSEEVEMEKLAPPNEPTEVGEW